MNLSRAKDAPANGFSRSHTENAPAGLACAVAGRGRFVPSGHSRRQQPRASHDEDDANKACDRAAEGSDLL